MRLAVRDSGGAGPPVVLIHGFPFDARLWDPQYQELGDDYRLIAPDLRGFGDSPAPDDTPLEMERHAGDVKETLEALDIDRAVVGGLSMGGYVALEFFRLFPRAVAGLMLADTRAEADAPAAKENRTKQQERVRREGTAGVVEDMLGALFAPATQRTKPELRAQLRAIMEQPSESFVAALEGMKNRRDSSALLTSISVPTLIVVGSEDGITPPDAAETMHRAIEGATLEVIPEAGHVSNLEDPERFNAALRRFLDSAARD